MHDLGGNLIFIPMRFGMIWTRGLGRNFNFSIFQPWLLQVFGGNLIVFHFCPFCMPAGHVDSEGISVFNLLCETSLRDLGGNLILSLSVLHDLAFCLIWEAI